MLLMDGTIDTHMWLQRTHIVPAAMLHASICTHSIGLFLLLSGSNFCLAVLESSQWTKLIL